MRGSRLTLAQQVTRLLSRSTVEKYTFEPGVAPRVTAAVHAAVVGEHAVADVGSLLKLIHVLRGKHRSPTAAQRLVDALRTSPAARRIIKAHWSAARRPRRNADLTPARSARAPQQDAKAPPGSVKASQFLTPGHELRAQHIAKKRSP
jgi:hypothetical protein